MRCAFCGGVALVPYETEASFVPVCGDCDVLVLDLSALLHRVEAVKEDEPWRGPSGSDWRPKVALYRQSVLSSAGGVSPSEVNTDG